MHSYKIKFKYCDPYTRGNWSENESVFNANSEYEAIKKCKEFFGLGVDCDYEIISVKEI